MSTGMSVRDLFRRLLGGTSAITKRSRSPRANGQPESAEVQPCERLEVRQLPTALSIVIDYSYDTNNFFDTQEKRDLFQQAADTYAARITDDLTAITPSGDNTWQAEFTDPATGQTTHAQNLTIAQDTLIVFAGGRDLSDATLGIGGPGGYSANGSSTWLATVDRRGQSGAAGSHPTDFGPWGGSITFDTSGTDWFFGETTDGMGADQADFLSVATHELGHILGFGTAASFDNLVSNHHFVGAKSDVEYNHANYPPLASDNSHWADGTMDDGNEVAMDPAISLGSRKLLTDLDWAALDDIGWTLTSTSDQPAPSITLTNSIPTFARTGPRVTLDSLATLDNSATVGLKGSQLVVTTLENRTKYDVITIGVGNGITKSGANLKFNGVVIGTYSNGRDGRAFKITFNYRATNEAIQACLRNIQFYTTSRKAGTLDRTLSFRMVNVDGQNSAPDTKVVHVT